MSTSDASFAVPQGVTLESWQAIGAVRIRKSWKIPERDAHGEIIGWAVRRDDGSKSFVKGTKRGLTMKWPLDPYAGSAASDPVYIVEGATDAAAGLGLGLTVVGRPSANGGGEHLAALLKARHACIIAENDDAGERGAALIAYKLIPGCTSVRMISPPAEHKDLRAWIAAGATRADIEARMRDAAPLTQSPECSLTVRMDTVEPEELIWLWLDRIPLGKLSLICGNPDVGKTFLTMDLAARVTRGGPWPGAPEEHRTAPGGVLIINGEDGLSDTLLPRLKSAGADLSRVRAVPMDRIRPGDRRGSFTLSDVEAIEAFLNEVPDCKLLCIDPASAFLGDVKENSNAEVRALLAPLAALAQRRGIAIVLVGHPNKAVGQSAIHRFMGSVAWTAAVRVSWMVMRDPDNPERRLMLRIKCNVGKPVPGLAYTIAGEPPRLEWDPEPVELSADTALNAVEGQASEPKRRSKLEFAKGWLKAALASGGRDAGELEREAEALEISRGTLKRARAELGITSTKGAFKSGWTWSLSPVAEGAQTPSTAPEGAQIDGVALLRQNQVENAPNGPKERKPPCVRPFVEGTVLSTPEQGASVLPLAEASGVTAEPPTPDRGGGGDHG